MTRTSHSYYVVMCDYGKRGLEAVVHPEDTRRDVVEMLATGEAKHVCFIHHVDGLFVEDVTDELFDEAEAFAQNANERAWDRFCSNFYGGGDPLTIREQQDAARRLK